MSSLVMLDADDPITTCDERSVEESTLSMQDLFRRKRQNYREQMQHLLSIPIKRKQELGSDNYNALQTRKLVQNIIDDEFVHEGDFRVGALVWDGEQKLGVVLTHDKKSSMVTVEYQDGEIVDEPEKKVKMHSLPGVGGCGPEL